MMQAFSSKQFRQALQDPSKIAAKLEKYVNQCKKHHIDIMFYILEELYNILTNTQTPMLKVNAIYALSTFLQTCEYPIVQMIQGCMLPVIQEIAFYQSQNRTYGKTSQYFKFKGYPGSIPNLDQLSHNYVTLSTNLIFTAAAIKPTYYFYTESLGTPSAFKSAANKLKQRKVEVPSACLSSEWKQKYEANIALFATTPEYESSYLNFFKGKVQKYLLEGAKGKDPLDFKKLLKNGDSWLTSELLGCLNQALDDDNFQVRRLALGLMHEFIINGDIEAVMIVNEGQIIEQIVERFLEVKGSSDLGRGGQIYPEIAGQLETKKNFYIELLKCIDTWGKLVPKAIYLDRQQDSKIARLLRKLKDRQFIFPSNENYPKLYKEFEDNMKKNQQRNNYIVRTLNQDDTEKPSIASQRMSKYSNKISLIREARESTILTMPQIEKLIDDAELALMELQVNERLIAKNMKTLRYYTQEFEKKFEMIEEEVTEEKLEAVYVKGAKCLEKIQYVGPIYEDYKNNNITFKQFAKMIAIRCEMVDKSKSRISDILSKLTRSKNSSRAGLDLSKSMRHNKQKQYEKKDHILQKSGLNLDRSANALEPVISHNTKTITNMSNLEQDPPIDNKPSIHHSQKISGSKISYSKSSKLKEQQSQVSSSEIHNNRRQSKNDTAKFIMDEYEIRPNNRPMPSAKTSNVDFSYSSNKPSFNSDPKQKKQDSIDHSNNFKKKSYGEASGSKIQSRNQSRNQSHASKRQSSRPSAHFRQFKSQSKKQNFSDCSQWSSSESEQPHFDVNSGKEKSSKEVNSSKGVESLRSGAKSGSRDVQISSKKGTSKEEKQIFQDSSFSKYNEQNEQIREQIDKQENPDFRIAFKGDGSGPNSKISKSIHSHEHYMNVLQSLAPRSIENERTISKISKDKTNSILPHRSQFDTSNRTNLMGTDRMALDNYTKIIPQNQDQQNVQDSNCRRSRLSVPQVKSSSRKESNLERQISKGILESSGRSKRKVQVGLNSRPSQSNQNYPSDQANRSNNLQTDKQFSRSFHRTEKSHQKSKLQSSRIRSKDAKQSVHLSRQSSFRNNISNNSSISKDASQSYYLKDISHPHLKQVHNHPQKQFKKQSFKEVNKNILKQSEPPSSSNRSKKSSSQRHSKESSGSKNSEHSKKLEFIVHYPSKQPMKSSLKSREENEYYATITSPQKDLKRQNNSNVSKVHHKNQQQIEDLERRLHQLKQQDDQLFVVRNQWKSPTRPQTLRTAVSPRFRNNNTDYSETVETFKRNQNQTTKKQTNKSNQTQYAEMDFNSNFFKAPEGRMIYKRIYKKDLAQLDRHLKRKILKGKELVYRNDDIEIGMMLHKNSKDLKIVYYITASRFLKSFLFKIDTCNKIVVHAIPASLSNLEPEKQYRIYLFGQLLEFPSKMPTIHFKYHPSLLTIEENMFEINEVNYFNSVIPFFFLKFFTTREVKPEYMQIQWSRGQIYRGEETRYSRRIIPKHFYLLQYFPDLINLESTQYESIYGMEMTYCNTCFLVRIVVKINNFFYVQGVLTSFNDQQNSQRLMEYAITCMTALLEKSQ